MPSATLGYAPDLEKYLKSLKGLPLEASVESLISLLKRRQIRDPEPCAVATAHILLQVVAKSKWHDVDSLINNVSRTGRRLASAQPRELVIGNIVRRVLGLIRDEAAEDRADGGNHSDSQSETSPNDGVEKRWTPSAASSNVVAKQDSAGDYLSSAAVKPTPRPGPPASYSAVNVPKSLFHLLAQTDPSDTESNGLGTPFGNSGTSTPQKGHTSAQVYALRAEVIEAIEEIKDEISQVDDQIAAMAEVHVHPGDYVLVHQPSPTVEKFILRAALRRKFVVLIAIDPSDTIDGKSQYASFRKKLIAAGISVINVSNAGLACYMPRVNRVLLGARAIVANGGVVTDAGAVALSRSAKQKGIAVVVLGGVYKLSPQSPFSISSTIEWGNPSAHVNFSNGPLVDGAEVMDGITELVPAEMIDTYISNLGTHSSDDLSSLISDHYKQEDIDFHLGNDRSNNSDWTLAAHMP